MSAQQLITKHLDLWTSAHKTRSIAGRGSNNKLNLHGIKKLRTLILELAVRGKLVPQDADDEPVSQLLTKIALAKAKLIKEGKIKKEKPLPEISQDEYPFELPKGWIFTRLGDLVEMFNGRAFKSTEWGNSGLPIIRIQNLNDPTAEFNYFNGKVDQKNLVDNGTFLISWSGTPGTSFGAFIWQRGLAALNQHINKCEFHFQDLNLEFMKLAVNGQMNNFIAKAQGGVGLKHVTKGTLNEAIIALPSLPEQHRIVAKVDELMAFCDQLEQTQSDNIAAHAQLVEALLAILTNSSDHNELQNNWQRIAAHFDTLFTTEHSIDQLKQTILQLAVMGKLVPQNPNDEPASELLKKIAAQKAQLIKEGKIKKEKPLPEITNEEKIFELPSGWEWVKLEFLATKSEAGWSPQCNGHPRADGKWGVLKVSAVSWGKYNPDENKELPDSLESRPDYEVKSGDFLISRANTAELVAKAVVVPANTPEKLMMSDKIIRFNFSPSISLNFIQLVNNSDQARSYYAAVAGGTSSSMKNVSREQIRNLVFALPPLNEQHRIVAKVDELISLCDTLKTNLQNAQKIQLALADTLVEQII